MNQRNYIWFKHRELFIQLFFVKHYHNWIDLGDNFHIAVFDGEDNELETAQVINTKAGVSNFFQRYKHTRVAMEAGTYSSWISRLLREVG